MTWRGSYHGGNNEAKTCVAGIGWVYSSTNVGRVWENASPHHESTRNRNISCQYRPGAGEIDGDGESLHSYTIRHSFRNTYSNPQNLVKRDISHSPERWKRSFCRSQG